MYEHGERQVSDDDLREAFIVSSDLDVHVERIREIERMGATMVVLVNNSGADPHSALGGLRRARPAPPRELALTADGKAGGPGAATCQDRRTPTRGVLP